MNKVQHGFRKGRGTNTAVMKMNRRLFNDINNGKVSSVMFLDFSRTFNTVDYDIILRKSAVYGVNDKSMVWFDII